MGTEVGNGDGNSLEASRVMWEMFDTLIFSMESGHLGNAVYSIYVGVNVCYVEILEIDAF